MLDALVSNATSFAHAGCSYFAMVARAISANASALIVYSDEGMPPVDMNCATTAQSARLEIGARKTRERSPTVDDECDDARHHDAVERAAL